ncbi:CRISPR-associated helicase Cas3' [Nocardiopsis changdeensis]|uniref:CRISPR-associated helicase Cas3 n=1 Tax=Nocardiopsis changdeensis TaxID=2831969 RepID=A0ABX8BHV4_9ACTN|nr:MULTISPECIES: CRISPR-associated helicase Cas3' [Nocardiopsis]QUX20617.1 CRISPR-associated helicase Cas3' [Nocardiopsis changdeensis]QYX36548.1 CRISPR-associated helicase Cas3' [Nocardiopsis sp. MT53]
MTSALEITITAPVASFRNPLYSGVQVTLPCPPPSTAAGLLAAAVGGWDRMPADTRIAMAFTAQGKGVDVETFHPLATAGKKPDPTPKDHEFLARTTLTLWVLDHLDLWERALRRPVWPLRLGRSQDLASARTSRITLYPGQGTQGHALLPAENSRSGMQLRMPHTISPDRSRIQWGTYRYAAQGSSARVDSEWRTSDGQAVVPLAPVHPHAAAGARVELPHIWAKSPDTRSQPPQPGEALTTHLQATTRALDTLHTRTGTLPATDARFWDRARLTCLFHDAGKVPDGFQTMVGNPPPQQPWGRRHEVYSLAFVEHVLAHLPEDERTWIGLGVLTHHRPLAGGEGSIRNETRTLTGPKDFHDHFGPVDPASANALATWLAQTAKAPTPAEATPEELAEAGHRLLERILTHWDRGQSPDEEAGLTAVLLQGAITLADHVASAHGHLLTTHPLTSIDYPARLRATLKAKNADTYPHQERAHATTTHMVLRAPTGKGKTEAALLWATTHTHHTADETAGTPRLFYALPYLASINAMATRLRTDLGHDQVGVVHSRAASFYLSTATCDTTPTDPAAAERQRASGAVAKANASRLFRELVRVTTPYQLLRGALGGTAHASTLIDTTNSTFVFDELHAYEPRRLGMILAMMGLWARLGGRIGVLSATLPDRLLDTIRAALGPDHTVELVEPDTDYTWPRRHRLHLREDHLTDPASIEDIQTSLRAGRSVAVIANNVADAWHLYDQLAPLARELHGDDAALLLHSRFKTGDRSRIEQAIRDRFGTRTTPRRPGLLVATQVVEVSLDVDFDVLHTSAAPLEALLQRFGRINRIGALDHPAPVIVHRPHYAPRGRSGPDFADKVYDAEPTRLGWDTLARHQGRELDERLFTAWLNEIYTSPWGDRWQDQADTSREDFRDQFLSFDQPLNDTTQLSAAFDAMFDGVDGTLAKDRQDYKDALQNTSPGEERGTGRLLASQYLIPLPHYARALGTWDHTLNVLIIDAEYEPDRGLITIHPPGNAAGAYQPGVLL